MMSYLVRLTDEERKTYQGNVLELRRGSTRLTYLEASAKEYQAKLRAEGRAEGRVERLGEQRSGLCRLAQRKFGVATATNLARQIEGVDDSAPLWEIGDLCHRLRLAGCQLELFEEPACEGIFHATGGLP